MYAPDTSAPSAPSALEVYQRVCGTRPLSVRSGRPETGIRLYRWGIKPVREAYVPRIRDLTMTIHLGGANRVRAFTEEGLSGRCSRPGDITLIPRGQAIHWLVEGGADFATLHVPAEAAAALEPHAGSDLLNLSECRFAFRDDYVLTSARTLIQAPDTPDRAARHYVSQMLEALLVHVVQVVKHNDGERIRLAQHNPMARGPANRALDPHELAHTIEQRLGDAISIRDLAELCGVGRSRFCEFFKAQFGTSPHHYVLGRRIARARQLLDAGARNVTEMAYALGFSSAAHFSTAFRNATGLSPSRYARRHRPDGDA